MTAAHRLYQRAPVAASLGMPSAAASDTAQPASFGPSCAVADFVISVHACERFVQRVQPNATLTEARAAIRSHAKAVLAACEVGCKSVRLSCGARLIIDPVGRQVITVYAAKPKLKHSPQRSGHALSFNAVKTGAKQW